ncbi:MAG: biopolymer transporter ExbD [Acidobacteriota bacterium]
MGMEIGAGATKSEPNVVPLCDILLVLLIIFMVVTPMIITDYTGQLPGAVNVVNQPEPAEHVTLALQNNGTVLIQSGTQREVVGDRSLLRERLLSVLEDRTDKMIYFKADSRMDYAQVAAVLDDVRRAGIEDVGVVAERATGRD